jgi:TPR repeat protein
MPPSMPSPDQQPRPAGYDQMTEEQRILSARFIREQKERELRAGPAVAGSFEEGLAAFKKGDYAMALRLWDPLADQGHAGAQYHIGFSYLKGHGVPQDFVRGMAWLRKAAEQGDVSAQYLLGAMYHHGNQGVQKDAGAAAAWFRKAAEQGYAPAQHLLGAMCSMSLEDSVQAYMWLTLAASRYGAPEKENRDRVLGFRRMLAVRMTPAQIAEAQKLAREWKASG